MDDLEATAQEAARRAGALLAERWRGAKSFERKSENPIDLVTDTDRACERVILETIRGRFPDDAVLAEESGRAEGGPRRWIVDPLDGTTNFAHGYPQFAVSIAVEEAGVLELAVVLDPVRGEMFHARRGRGAFLGDEPLHVSEAPDLERALLVTGFPYDRRRHADFYLAYFRDFMMRAHGIRRAGSAALDLAWVAAGRVDGFWEWRLSPWDTAAGALLVTEAGGRITDFRDRPFDPFGDQTLATNAHIHAEMLTVLATRGTTPPD